MQIKSRLKASVMAAVLAAAPMMVQSAGLGRLNVLSGLGQPLRAEIELIAVSANEVETLRAALASSDSFAQAQIEFPSTAMGLRFNVEKRSNGQFFIAVNSSQSITEPFFDFLVELKWEGGRVVREYTALLDPVGYNGSVNQVAPVVRPASQPSATKPSKPVAETPVRAQESVAAVAAKSPEEKQREEKPRAEKPATERASREAHLVHKGETLMAIARHNQQEGVSLEQMLVGLYRANEDAFEGRNMNRLKKGKILAIPSREQLLSSDKATAMREIKVHAQDWHAYRAKLAEQAGAAQEPVSSGSGKITTKLEEKTPQLAAGKDKLQISKGEEGKLRERVQALEEELSARQKSILDMNAHVGELEKTNKKLEALLALKTKQGEALQKQAEQAKQEQVKPAAQEPAPVSPEKPIEAAPEVVKPAAVDKPAQVKPEPAPPVKAAAPKPVKKAPVIIEEVEPEPSLLDNPMVLMGGAGAALLALAGGVIALLRRRKGTSFEDSIITGSDLKSNTVVGNTGGAVISTGVTENSFLTDFSRAGLGTIDTDEVDPIAEAEVYMAYGRDAQAEEILRDALSRDGSRQEVRLKLLEIYHARPSVAPFEQVAQELYTGTNGQGPLWAQAAEMGRAIDPSNALYQSSAPVDTGALDQTMVLSAGTLSAQQASPSLDMDFNVDSADLDLGGDLDFQLDEAQAVQGEGANEPILDILGNAEPTQDEAEANLDFDLGDVSLDLEPASSSAPEDGMLTLDIPLEEAPAELDMDLTLDAMPELSAMEDAATPAADDLSLDFELPEIAPASEAAPADTELMDFELDLGQDLETEANAPQETAAAEVEEEAVADLDFNFDDLEPAAAAAEPEEISLDLDVAPSNAGEESVMDFAAELDDPVTTKLDLARAYLDMGDKEGAREILQEALDEGSAEQKSTAQTLLAQI